MPCIETYLVPPLVGGAPSQRHALLVKRLDTQNSLISQTDACIELQKEWPCTPWSITYTYLYVLFMFALFMSVHFMSALLMFVFLRESAGHGMLFMYASLTYALYMHAILIRVHAQRGPAPP